MACCTSDDMRATYCTCFSCYIGSAGTVHAVPKCVADNYHHRHVANSVREILGDGQLHQGKQQLLLQATQRPTAPCCLPPRTAVDKVGYCHLTALGCRLWRRRWRRGLRHQWWTGELLSWSQSPKPGSTSLHRTPARLSWTGIRRPKQTYAP